MCTRTVRIALEAVYGTSLQLRRFERSTDRGESDLARAAGRGYDERSSPLEVRDRRARYMLRWTGVLAFALTAIVTVGWLAMTHPWSGNAEPPRDDPAADRDAKPAKAIPFDAKRAMGYLEQICKIGPRISGTQGMKKQQELLKKHFETHGGKASFQEFTARQRSRRDAVTMANLIVRWHEERPRRVILCSHYDTRPIADQEENPRNWHQPFLSANDGGSGVACLMELAHHMRNVPTEVGVDFVFFDGEEYIFQQGHDKYFFGSEHFADQYRKARP